MSITQTPLIGDSIAQAMLAEFETQAPVTRRFLERLPGDKLTWKPHGEAIDDRRPVGISRRAYAGRRGPLYSRTNPAQAPEFAKFLQPASCQEIMQTFDQSVTVVREILPSIGDAEMAETLAAVGRRQRGAGAAA